LELNPLGPVQLKTAPDVVVDKVKLILSPEQTELGPPKENEGTGEPVMQLNPDRILAPG
jgi:hypothetical protein